MTPAALLRKAEEHESLAAELRRRAAEMASQEREMAIVEALDLYDGELWTRAKALAVDLKAYAANGWRREFAVDELPDGAPQKRRAWHRILRSRGGAPIGDRQMFNIAKLKSGAVAISTDGM